MAEHIERAATNTDGRKDDRKIKTPFAQIIVGGTVEKPCYSILYFDTTDGTCHIGFSSYSLEYVFQWLKDEFEVTRDRSAVEVMPVVRGWWIKRSGWHECSKCGTVGLPYWKACPSCAARMDGEVSDKR